jgi:hypothetical protein
LRRGVTSLNEQEEIARSLGGILCECDPAVNGHLRMPIAPAGMCPNCGTEGPFFRTALELAKINGHKLTDTSSVAEKYRRIDWTAAFKEEPEDIRWLKEDFLEAGTLVCLFSKPGIGKSLLALEIALEVVRNGKTVMYIDDENRREDVVDRLRSFRVGSEELGNLVYFSFQNLPALDTVRGGEHLEALAEQYQPALLVMDTVSRMVQGPENDSDTYLGLYRNSLTRMKGRDIAVLRLDHTGKDSTRGQRGSSAKESDADYLWLLTREGESVFSLECQKSRPGHIPYGTIINLVRKYEPLRHIWDVKIDMPLSRYEWLMKKMEELGISPSLGRDKVRKILKDHNITSMRNDALQAAIIERRNRQRRFVPVLGNGWERGNVDEDGCPF